MDVNVNVDRNIDMGIDMDMATTNTLIKGY